ncbi:MAG: hypothetical protein JWN70_1579 [Planctomycetaceae bacterium]|nr:hypothetical protein [Planctomycetaceae bacterium]
MANVVQVCMCVRLIGDFLATDSHGLNTEYGNIKARPSGIPLELNKE